MDATTLSALIGLAGICLSGIVSYWVAYRQIAQRYSELLYEHRLKCYPELYRILSDFAKLLRYGQFTGDEVRGLLEDIDEWDSTHALLLSPVSTRRIVSMRMRLASVVYRGKPFEGEEAVAEMLVCISDLENALKTELGVYNGKGFHNPARVIRLGEVDTVRDPARYLKSGER